MSDGRKEWRSVHVCPECSHQISLNEISLKSVTTGIVVCNICGTGHQIDVRVVPAKA